MKKLSYLEKACTEFRKKFLLFMWTILSVASSSQGFSQETIKIYHGQGGTSAILAASSGTKILNDTLHRLVIPVGEVVTIELVNPNPALYNYSFDKTDLTIDDEPLPDIGLLVQALSKVLGLDIPSSNSAGVAPVINSELANLEAKLANLKAVLTDINSFILESDDVENTFEALNHRNTGGFRKAVTKIRAKYTIEKLDTYEEALRDQLKKVVAAGEFPDLNGDGVKDPIFEETFKAYITSLGLTIKELEKNFVNRDIKTILKFSFKAGTKAELVKLSVKGKSESARRDRGSLLAIEIRPFKDNLFEVIPFYSMLYSANKIDYKISDGKIVEIPAADFTFRPGATLIANVYRFGKLKEFSLGPGLGFSIRKNTTFIENFHVGALFSYREILRIGLGWGQQQYPVALIDGVSVGGALPNNVDGITDVIVYKGRPAFMINFSILGLKIPGQ